MSVYCEVKFTSKQFIVETGGKVKSETVELKRQTAASTGKTPSWSEIFSFNYSKLTKHGYRELKECITELEEPLQ